MDIEKALKILEKTANEAEIFYSRDKDTEINIKNGKIDSYIENISEGYGIRVIVDKKLGFCYSTKLERDIIEKAIKIAKISKKDESLSLPSNQEYHSKSLFDKRIVNIREDEINKFTEDLIQPCTEQKVILSFGVLSFGTTYVEIWNTNGIQCKDQGTEISCYVSTVAKEDMDISTGFEYGASTKLDLDFYNIGYCAAKLAKNSLKARKIDVLTTNLILKPIAIAELLEYTLIPSLSADNIQKNRSLLSNKIGNRLFSEIDIIDDGTLEGALYTSKFDGEGVARQRTKLVEKGVLCGYLYDTYTANKENKKSTGNASRSYSSLPTISPSNFIVSGKGKLSEEGLVVHGLIGAHTSNFVTGDFSVETRNAFLNGKPVKKAIISGNIYELLKKVVGFGKDYKQVSNVIAPSIEFEEIRVAG